MQIRARMSMSADGYVTTPSGWPALTADPAYVSPPRWWASSTCSPFRPAHGPFGPLWSTCR
ncbi:hypothetical protein ACFYM2_11585 [Streptomyces sp. NPDC006711]|uniref:hypothetical protein n=1 Tax=unclassified Streptomyces TaxID=2593676 RepID=UPI0033EFA586